MVRLPNDLVEADPDATLTSLVGPDDTITSSEAELLTSDYWLANEEYGGPFDVCFVIADEASDDDFVLDYTPAGYTWELAVVSKLGDPNTHYLFEDPVEGDEFETGGYDQVIACNNVDTESDGGCALTQGYWKTHCQYAPAPYDATWSMAPDAEDTLFYGSDQTWYQVLWTTQRQADLGSPCMHGDPVPMGGATWPHAAARRHIVWHGPAAGSRGPSRTAGWERACLNLSGSEEPRGGSRRSSRPSWPSPR